MFDNYYEIYLNSVLELAQTIVIKSEYSALKLNDYYRVTAPDSFNESDPRTWKYYLNISGQYYPTDTIMHVVSLDTQEPIVFNTTNLASHRATWREYQYGTRYYKELVNQYPDQEQLILGILYPCDIDYAIEAPDYSVLGYPKHLVEDHELTLIEDISNFSMSFMRRWNNTQYRITDDLNEATLLGILYLNLVPAILNFRLERCHTNEVHSYHITEYLASHGFLDRFIDTLTRKQALYFYRNIRVIQRRIGRQETYGWLLDNILTERRIPLTSYSMTHVVGPMLEGEEEDQLVRFKRSSENKVGPQEHPILVSTDLILAKEDRLAPLNEEERIDKAKDIERAFHHSLSNRVKTKVLESTMVDYSDSALYPLEDILLDHWIYLSSKNIYNSYVSVTNPKTNEIIPLSVKDAYVFALYLSAYTIGIELVEVPKVLVNRVQLIPSAKPSDLLSIADSDLMDESDALALLEYQPEIVPVISTEAFYNKCLEIYLASNHQYNLISYEEDFRRRGYLEAMASRIYGTALVSLTDDDHVLYADWFLERNIDIQDFIDENLDQHYALVMRQATGLDLNTTVSVKNTQAKMIQMFSELSSYSLQFLADINEGRIHVLGWDVIRAGNIDSDIKSNYSYIDVKVDVMQVRGSLSQVEDINVNGLTDVYDVKGSLDAKFDLELPELISIEPLARNDFYLVNTSKVGVSVDMELPQDLPAGVIPVLGIENYLALSDIERAMVPDDYGYVPDFSLIDSDPDNPFTRP